MGTIRKRGKVWYVDYYYKGKRYIKAISKHKRLAELVLKDIEVKIEKEEHLGIHATGRITFPSMAEKYLEFSKTNKAEKSYKRDILSLKHLKEFFGNAYLQEITTEKIESYKNQRAEKVSNATINRELACLKHLFTKAIEWGYIDKNSSKKVKLLKEPPGRVRYLEKDEIKKLLKNCSDNIRPIVITALTTGMRLSELFNLRWQDIDFEEKVIIVRNSKNNESRILPMNQTLYSTLVALPRTNEFVFTSKNGNPYKSIKTSFKNALKKAKIENFRFHDLRHTFASHLAMNGWNLRTIQQLMGHKTFAMTLRYSHLSKTHLQEAVYSLDKNFVDEDGNNLVANRLDQKIKHLKTC